MAIDQIPVKTYVKIRLENLLWDSVSLLETIPIGVLSDRHQRKVEKIMQKMNKLADEIYDELEMED